MARIRSIKPDFWESDDTATLSPVAALTYSGLWNYSDDEGRGRYQPSIIFTRLHALREGMSVAKTKTALQELIDKKLIIIYEANGYGALYYIPSFKKHQHPDRPQPSKLPAPPLTQDVVGAESTNPKRAGSEAAPLGEEEGEDRNKERRGEHPPLVETDPTDEDIVAAVHRWEPTFPAHKIRSETARAIRLGIPKARLLKDIQTTGERLRIWTIVDGYQTEKGKPRNGAHGHRENATAYDRSSKPSVLDERREDVQKRQDDARAKCDAILEAMDPDEHDGWTRDAEALADKAGVKDDRARAVFVKAELRRKVASENRIEGL